MANLNVDKRIFELPPFMHRVYSAIQPTSSVGPYGVQ